MEQQLVCPECGGDLHTLEESTAWGRPDFIQYEDREREVSWGSGGEVDSPDWETVGIECDSCPFKRRYTSEVGQGDVLALLVTASEWEERAEAREGFVDVHPPTRPGT